MQPEQDFRYLGPTSTTAGREIDQLEAEIAYNDKLSGTFATSGWKLLEELIETKAAETRRALTLPGGKQTLEEIFAQRERLAILNWLLYLPVETTDSLTRAGEELYELRERQTR